MVLSVAAAGITGVIYLLPILFVLPEVSYLLAATNGQPIGLVFKQATGSAGGGFGLLFLILGIMFFAGIGALTASSRCTYAFARDGGVPGSRWFGTTNKQLGIPFWGLVLSTVVCSLLGLIYFGSTAAFGSFTGVATICLSCGYGLPILVSVLRGRKLVKHSTFSLGKFGFVINGICLVWIALAIVLFCMPVAIPVTPSSMNYASVVFAGCVVNTSLQNISIGLTNRDIVLLQSPLDGTLLVDESTSPVRQSFRMPTQQSEVKQSSRTMRSILVMIRHMRIFKRRCESC